MIAALMAAEALGGTVLVEFCGTYNADYSDVSEVISQLDDDYFRNNDPRPARGAAIAVRDNHTNLSVTLRLDDDTETCPDGNACACGATIALDDTHTYNLKLLADIVIGNNAFVVRNNDQDDARWVHQGPTAWSPVAGIKHLTSGQHAAWRIAAAAGWALHRRGGIVCDDPFTFYTQTCPTGDPGTSCQKGGGRIYIAPTADNQKNIIVHEEGHWMSVCANEGVNAANYGANGSFDGVCDPDDGTMVKKVNAGGAAIEGIAWYWAAVAFNDTAGADCEFSKAADYNQDNLKGVQFDGELSASCEGGTANTWAGADYIGNECGGTVEDRGTYYDYLRAFWDAEQGQGLTTAQVFQIYADADPESWDGDGGGLGASDDPQERLEASALANGVSTQWNNVDAVNGLR